LEEQKILIYVMSLCSSLLKMFLKWLTQ